MVLPETDPVYVTTPTAPKVRVVPASFPEMPRVWAGSERAIWPLKVDPDCVQVSVNVPFNTPLYDPVHVPERPPAAAVVGAAVAVGVLVGALVGVLLTGMLDGVGVPVVDDALHAAISATRGIAMPIRMVRFISQVLPLVELLSGHHGRSAALVERRPLSRSRQRES
jgi:hypothetical protein